MSNKEKLPKLVNVYKPSHTLGKRQLPLVVDENLTLIMDVRNSGIACDGPLIRGKELEEFNRKWEILSEEELSAALQITKSELMNVLNQNVPCVGCRRSVEKFYNELLKSGHPTLDPLLVKADGTITIKEEKQFMPQVLCTIFHDHSIRLERIIENQPKKSKKSVRCLLHSLDTQRSRLLTPVWRDVWDCMRGDCKKDVCTIEAPSLYATLETYLRKHRFCGECKTKVIRAYDVLMKEDKSCEDKSYNPALYSGIKLCLTNNKHIHLPTETDYIVKLICKAEPELLGSRRERHAKTLEIAQEEVLTCLGICIYERLHRIYMRMKEEECTCQVFAAVAVDTLSRSFETAVERKQGISQLELLYAELTREEQQKQIRREQKKIKRKRKKEKSLEQDGKENCNDCEEDCDDKDDLVDKDCSCSSNKNEESCCHCEELHSPLKNSLLKCKEDLNNECDCKISKQDQLRCNTNERWINDCKCENDIKEHKCANFIQTVDFKKENGSSSDHSHDCGYSSEHNNGCCETGSLVSSMSSSPEGSELACSDSCCQHDTDYTTFGKYGHQPSLQDMLESFSDDEDDSNWKLTPEEVWEFENKHKQIVEKRQQLRETLKKKFIDFCAYGPLQVPRLLVQTKYASN